MDNPYGHKHYELRRQFWKFAGANVRVFDGSGNLVFFAQQKAWKLKEDFRIYADEGKTRELLRIAARKVIDFSGTYDVFDSQSNERIGVLRRKGLSSTFMYDHWLMLNPAEQQVGEVVENHAVLAVLRRYVDFVSLISPQSYDIMVQGRKVAELRQHFNPFLYKLSIDFSHDFSGMLDKRLGLAAVILLATIERRQN